MPVPTLMRRIATFATVAVLTVSTTACPELFEPDSDEEEDTTSTSSGYNLVCPANLPVGFHCVLNSGISAPAKYSLPPEVVGHWVDTGAQVCMALGVSPAPVPAMSSFRYKGGFGGGVTTEANLWGGLVSRTGQLQPNSSTFYVFTGSSDPQIKLLTFDMSQRRFIGWGFTKMSCPW